MEHRAALLVAFSQTELAASPPVHAAGSSALAERPALLDRRLSCRSHDALPCAITPCDRSASLPTSVCRLSSSFSRAIIFSSRPTTTSSNFSRSRIFSCSSALRLFQVAHHFFVLAHVTQNADRADDLAVGIAERRRVEGRRNHLSARAARVQAGVAGDAPLDHFPQGGRELARLLGLK